MVFLSGNKATDQQTRVNFTVALSSHPHTARMIEKRCIRHCVIHGRFQVLTEHQLRPIVLRDVATGPAQSDAVAIAPYQAARWAGLHIPGLSIWSDIAGFAAALYRRANHQFS